MPESAPIPEIAVVLAALEVLRERYHSAGCQLVQVTMTVRTPCGVSVDHSISPADYLPFRAGLDAGPNFAPAPDTPDTEPAGTPPDTTPDLPTLTALERTIIDVLAVAERPLKQATVARRSQARLNSYFRGLFSRLKQWGLVVHVEGPNDSGWWLAARPLPAGCHVRPT